MTTKGIEQLADKVTGKGFSPRSISSSTHQSLTSASSPKPVYLGFDVGNYPAAGDPLMKAWFNGTAPDDPPFYYVGFYLAPAPNHSDTSWMGKRSFLQGIGYGFLIVYVGRQANNQTYAQGHTDGIQAASLASQAGFTSGIIYLDREGGNPLTTGQLSYCQGWADAVNGTYFKAGIYCSYLVADQINSNVSGIKRFWCVGTNNSPGCTTNIGSKQPTDCGTSLASTWQYAISPSGTECPQTFNGYTLAVDLDMSYNQNPSAP